VVAVSSVVVTSSSRRLNLFCVAICCKVLYKILEKSIFI
jgi:hypothetical protein